jgi:hypothetical protein
MLLEERLGAAVDFPTLLSIKQINIFLNLSSWEIMGTPVTPSCCKNCLATHVAVIEDIT